MKNTNFPYSYPKTLTAVFGILLFFFFSPFRAAALDMGDLGFFGQLPSTILTAKSYIVIDDQNGNVLAAKDSKLLWPAASMTKLVTAMVLLDLGYTPKKLITITKNDQVGGSGVALKTGYKYTTQDLLSAALIHSSNNAAKALARSNGLSEEDFVKKMNEKAKSLGAISTSFEDPTGLSPKNLTTAEDFAKIALEALKYPEISKAAKTKTLTIRSYGKTKIYYHKLINTNQLLKDPEVAVLGAKTGYIEESSRNFCAVVKDKFGSQFTVVLLGSQNQTTQFKEAKELINMGGLAKIFASPANNNSAILGVNTLDN